MILEGGGRQAAQDLFDHLKEYGIFVVSGGEIEFWLKQLAVTGHGPAWLIDVFKRMGEDPESPAYLKPSDDDVWKFLAEIKNWLMEPKRKGIPA